MHPDHVERIIEAQFEFQPHRQRAQHPGRHAYRQGTQDINRRAGRRDGDQSGDDARRRAQRRSLAISDALREQPAKHGRGRRNRGGDKRRPGNTVGGRRRSCVEPVPAEPQQGGPEHHKRQIVRSKQRRRPTASFAQHDRQHQGRHTGVDMNRGAAGEVDGVQLVGDPAAVLSGETVKCEDPVCDREIDERRPQTGEQQPGAELQPVGHRPGDQRNRDDREHQLECHKHGRRQGTRQRNIHRGGLRARIGSNSIDADETFETPVLARVAGDVANVITERNRVAVKRPEHRHDTHRADAHHDHVQDALGTHHAAVEKCQTRRHQQHERGTHQHPGGVAAIRNAHDGELVHSLSPPVERWHGPSLTTDDLIQNHAH
ncbi:Uncharacterised protein [Mycobacterium tuberculosis]|nr:Uncharacterised protein [Mycobacterium tuberculosis]